MTKDGRSIQRSERCATCVVTALCLAMLTEDDPELLLANSFHGHVMATKPKPSQSAWGFGRGAAPTDWSPTAMPEGQKSLAGNRLSTQGRCR